jgi:xanthine dehydrogenase large subunit
VQGAGWLTMEELVWDDRGALRTHAPSTYKIPACSDRPRRLQRGALGRGEPGGHDLSLQGGGGAAPDAGDQRAFGAGAGLCRLRAELSPDLQAPATPEAILAAVTRARG